VSRTRWLGLAVGIAALSLVAALVVLTVHVGKPTPGTRTASGTSTGPSVTATTSSAATNSAAVHPPPHFDTPEAAMRYLALAWNNNDLVSLRHVTDPSARSQLLSMHSEAVNLRLDHCTKRPQGDYLCTFSHDYPPGTSTTIAGGVGRAEFVVGPALTPGWYMTVFQSCG
jgi:hypothetical protein